MRNLLPLAFCLALSGIVCHAAVLDPEQALARLHSTSAPAKVRSSANAINPEPVLTLRSVGQPTAYVFNRGDLSRGYIVVSADDCAPALLGWSDSGTFNIDDMPENLAYWLENYNNQIAWLRGRDANDGPALSKALATRHAISPLVATRWNQDAPFNDKCPEINGKHCVTGCVATAMSQLLKYFNWPEAGVGTHSYSWNNGSESQTLSFDYEDTTFEWNNMLNVYGANATATQNDAVATLMYACGVSVDMDYTADESGAQSFAVLNALINIFKYAPNAEFLQRDYYTLEQWEDLIYNNLVNYGPVIYGGQSGTGGHEFICDGYSDGGYFHFNWGWGGMSDGYFLLDALDPGAQGIGGSSGGYNFAQDIIINVTPDRGQHISVVPNLCFAGDFSLSPQSATIGSDVTPTFSFYSYTPTDMTVSLGLKFVQQPDGEPMYVPASASSATVRSGYGMEGTTVSVFLPTTITEGTYQVYPAYEVGDTWYDFAQEVASVQYYTMTVANSQATFQPQAEVAVELEDVVAVSDFYAGKQFEITATIVNPDDRAYYGTIYGALLVVSGTSAQLADVASPQLVDLDGNSGTNIDYISTFANAAPGEYYFAFLAPAAVDSRQMRLVSQPVPVTVQEAPTTSSVNVANLTFDCGNQNVVPRDNIGITVTVECSEGIFYGPLTYVIFEPNGNQWTSVAAFTSKTLFLKAPETTTLSINGNFSNGELGKTYAAAVYNGQTQMTPLSEFVLTGAMTDVRSLTNEVSVATTEYYDLNGRKVNADNISRGLYISVTKYTDGTMTTTKRVVR